MALPTVFQSTQQDRALATALGLLTPSRFNSGVVAPFTVVPLVNASVTWTNMPAAATEFTGTPRTKAELTNYDECRLVVSVGVAGFGGSSLQCQFSSNESDWTNLTPAVATSDTGTIVSTWATLTSSSPAKNDVFLRIMGSGGNGQIDPQFRLVQLQLR